MQKIYYFYEEMLSAFMKRLVAAILLFSAAVAPDLLTAQENMSEGNPRPKVGLVLSGGGAKGVAHISVLKVLEEAGIPIDYIAGTSMGAIIGGLYSIGYTSHELDSMARTQDWMALLSDRVERSSKLFYERENADTYLISIPFVIEKEKVSLTLPSGATAGQNVRNLLNEMTIGYHDGDMDFDKLPIPFACVAYDMVKGEEYVFRSGNLPTAIRSSMSIPGAFAPVLLDSMVLVDGGIYNNFPVDVVKEMGAGFVIGVDLSAGKPELEEVNSIMGMIDQMTAIMGRGKYICNKNSVDIYMNPRVKPYNSTSFTAEAIDSLIYWGELEARAHWDEIVALKERICGVDYAEAKPERPRILDADSLMVGNISFSGLTNSEESMLRANLRIEENSMTTKLELNRAIGRLRGSGAFSYVTYTLESNPPYGLHISVSERGETLLKLGFRFDTEQTASILLGSSHTFRGLLGPKVEITARLNDNPYVKLDFNSSRLLLGRFGVSYMYRHSNYNFRHGGEGDTRVSAGINRAELFFNNANARQFSINFGVRYEHFNYRSFLLTSGSDWEIVQPKGFLNYYAQGNFENLDSFYYPTRGLSLHTQVMLHTDNGYTFEGYVPFMSARYHFRTVFMANSRLAFIPSLFGRTLIGQNPHFAYQNAIGGEIEGRYVTQQMPFPGTRNVEMLDNSFMALSLEVRQRIFSRNYVSVRGAFASQNDDFFRMFSSDIADKHIWGVALKYSYDSAIGPISLQLDKSNLDNGIGAYFSLGKVF